MNLLVMLVGFREFPFVQEQSIKTVVRAQLEFGVHLDRLKGAYFHANLAAHADRYIDIENLRVILHLARMVRLLDRVLLDVDALRRAFLFTDEASDASQSQFRIVSVEDKKWEVAARFLNSVTLLRILHGNETLLVLVTPDKISGSFNHAFDYSSSEHINSSIYFA